MPESEYEPRQVTKAMIQANFMLASLTPNQKAKFLEVLTAKFIADGDMPGLQHAMNVVRRNVPS